MKTRIYTIARSIARCDALKQALKPISQIGSLGIPKEPVGDTGNKKTWAHLHLKEVRLL